MTARYGPLRPGSFMDLDEDALPVLINDAALVALDIRESMTHLGLAGPAEDRKIGHVEGPDSLSVHVQDDALGYVVEGDPALRERHPIRTRHLECLCQSADTVWRLDEAPPALLGFLCHQMFDVLLAAASPDTLSRLHPGWLLDEDMARTFGARLDARALVDWFAGLTSADLRERETAMLIEIATHRQDSVMALRQLQFLHPELSCAIWRDDGELHLASAIERRAHGKAHGILDLLEAGWDQLPADTLARALAFPKRPGALFSPEGQAVLDRMLTLLARACEQARIATWQMNHIARVGGPLSMVIGRCLQGLPALADVLEAVARMRRCGALQDSVMVDLLSVSDRPGGYHGLLLLNALATRGNSGIQVYFDWVLRDGPEALPEDIVRQLLLPDASAAMRETCLRDICLLGDGEPLRLYLDALDRARVKLVLPISQRLWVATTLISTASGSANRVIGHAMCDGASQVGLVVLQWLLKLGAAGDLTESELSSALDFPPPRTLLEQALHDDESRLVETYLDLVTVMLERQAITAPMLKRYLSVNPDHIGGFGDIVRRRDEHHQWIPSAPSIMETGLRRLRANGWLSEEMLAALLAPLRRAP